MKFSHIVIIFSFFLVVGCLFFCQDWILSYLDDYAVRVTQEKYGSQSLAPEHEAKIRNIARQMNIVDFFIIRKMNRQMLLAMGYYNAFAYYPLFLGCIPISSTFFLYFSEGFFQDLSLEEQQFLIGHELAHIKERHFQYLNFVWIFFVIVLISLVWRLKNTVINRVVTKRVPFDYQGYVQKGTVCLLLYLSLLIPNLCCLAYRRHSEWVADEASLKMLNSHNGALRLFDRWQNEFKVPEQNSCCGLFATHPQLYDRKKYCLNLKNTQEEFP